MSAVAFRGFVSGLPPFICGVLISLLVYSWTGQTSQSIARPPEGLGEAYLGRKVDNLKSTLAKTEQKLEDERRLVAKLNRKLSDKSLDRKIDNLSRTLAKTEQKLQAERQLVRHLKRELSDASLQIDVFSQLRRASGESSDPIWPSTAVAAKDETSVLAPYVVGARTLVGVGTVGLIGNATRVTSKSPYSPRKLRKASKASSISKARKVRRTRPVILSPSRHVAASIPSARHTTREVTHAANKQSTRDVRETADASRQQAALALPRLGQAESVAPRRARKSRTRAVRRLPKPRRLGRLNRRQRSSVRRRSAVVRSSGSFFNRVARRGVFGDAYAVH